MQTTWRPSSPRCAAKSHLPPARYLKLAGVGSATRVGSELEASTSNPRMAYRAWNRLLR